jgi:hypothetical protein
MRTTGGTVRRYRAAGSPGRWNSDENEMVMFRCCRGHSVGGGPACQCDVSDQFISLGSSVSTPKGFGDQPDDSEPFRSVLHFLLALSCLRNQNSETDSDAGN